MIHTAPLNLDQFATKEDSAELPIELDVWSYWYSEGYPVEDIINAYTAVHKKPDDEDTAHIVLEVETLAKPIDEADVAVDDTTVYCCDCKGYAYHYNVDLEEYSVTEWGACPHIESVDPSIKATNDPNQSQLE